MDEQLKRDQRRLERLKRWLPELRAWRNARVARIEDWQFTGSDGQTVPLKAGDAWPSVDTPVKLTATATVPKEWSGQPVEVELWLGGEGFVKLTPGYQIGLNPFHHDFPITDKAKGGEKIQIEAEVVPKGMFGAHVYAPAIDRALLAVPYPEVRDLERDLKMVIETAEQLKEHEAFPLFLDLADAAYRALAPGWPTDFDTAMTRYVSGDIEGGNRLSVGLGDYGVPGYQGELVLTGIWHIPPPKDALQPLPESAFPAIAEARQVIADGVEGIKRRYPPIGNLTLSGHAHIDLAWLWPVAETKRKVRRTFSSVLHLMDVFADFTFNQSSAQAYVWMEQEDPELFKRIQQRVKEGRWEPIGGSWLEPDCQVTGGEAFVRQLFYGQRFFQSRFGLRNTVAWLPDVFGFSGAIPQLLLGAGLTSFFTTKLNWNETDQFPFDLFQWEGIDGSRVLAHSFFNPDRGYNGNIIPEDTYGTWKAFRGKRLTDQTLLAFGWGDGGGGPDAEMLENYQRIKDYPVLPRLKMGKIEEFFAELPRENLPVYVGEQYLELHRATLTTQGMTKQLNRQSEHRLTEAETFGAIAALNAGFPYPGKQLDEGWTTLLLNQFHDILPGSSIHEVYQDTHAMLHGVIESATALRDVAVAHLAGPSKGGIAVANPDLHERPLTVVLPAETKGVALDGDALPMQEVAGGQLVHDPDRAVAPLSVAGLSTTKKSAKPARTVSAKSGKKESVLENDLLRVVIGADGTLQSMTDKAANREVLADRANQLWAYIDRPRAWDAWDIDETYEDFGMEITEVDKIEVVEEGPLRAAIRVSRTWRSSTFTQTYRLLAGSKRLDIVNDIDWHERLVLIRALFPLEIHAHEATFETMYGVVRRATHRNTSWEQAKFEASAHRFVDLSEPNYGVALLNDAKYGHSAHGNVLGISLVRGPLHPDPMADEGEHHFTYSLLPHEGDWVAGKVTREARALNSPLVTANAGDGKSGESFVVNEGLELGIGTLKRAHDRKGTVLRLYEPHGDRGQATLRFAKSPKSVRRVNLLEEDIDGGKLDVKKGAVTLDVRPFEVLTLLIES